MKKYRKFKQFPKRKSFQLTASEPVWRLISQLTKTRGLCRKRNHHIFVNFWIAFLRSFHFNCLSIATNPLMYLLMLYQMSLLPESFRADFASERFLAGVRSQVNFDIALVQEASIADGAPVYWFLLPQQTAKIIRRLEAMCRYWHVVLILYLLLHLLLMATGTTRWHT